MAFAEAIQSVAALSKTLKDVAGLALDQAVRERVLEAMELATVARAGLLAEQERSFALSREASELRADLNKAVNWHLRAEGFQVLQQGGGVVWASKATRGLLACPVCFERREVQYLQGEPHYLLCPACKASYSLDRSEGPRQAITDFNPFNRE
jgi:hypothetical protein